MEHKSQREVGSEKGRNDERLLGEETRWRKGQFIEAILIK